MFFVQKRLDVQFQGLFVMNEQNFIKEPQQMRVVFEVLFEGQFEPRIQKSVNLV